jgi:hypothetical protein
MGWQDREYNAGREEMKAYFANPLGLMQYALPIYRSAQLQIRLTFWFLLISVFVAIGDIQAGRPQYIPMDFAILLGVSLLHEWGHMIFSRRVGGNHWEWVLWTMGGMIPPTSPRRPLPVFVANIGGFAFNILLIAFLAGATLAFGGSVAPGYVFLIPVGLSASIPNAPESVNWGLDFAMIWSCRMILINLFPCYWFDGGHLWQAVLWPKLGQRKSGLVTVWAGMVLAVPLFFLALWSRSPLGMVFWAMIFADCFRRRQMLAAIDDDYMDAEETSYNYMDSPEPRAKKKHKKGWLKSARKRAIRDQAEQAKIDAILAKVKDKGLHSLTWWEKRTLKKATERQRQHDLASRL